MSWGAKLQARDAEAQASEGAQAAISVRPLRGGFAVFRGETCVSGVNCRQHAEMMAEGLSRKAASRKRRCLCCGARFASEGPGHRMCGGCREGRKLPSAQFEGW